ncbi:MAG: hypothetical protein IOD12_01595, partial [Silvanigrellales bacterium]|nr:hypothetical protein [Silvanigrellales bacterium]
MKAGFRRLRTVVSVIFVVPGLASAAKYVEHPVQVPAHSLSEKPPPLFSKDMDHTLEAPLPTSGHALSAHVRHLGTEDPAYAVVVSPSKKEVDVVLRTETGELRTLTRFPIVSMAREVSQDPLERAFYPVSFERQAVRAWDVSRPERGSRLRGTEVLFGEASKAPKTRRRSASAAFTLAPRNFAALMAVLVPLKTPVLVLPKTDSRPTSSNPLQKATRAALPSPETASVETVLARVGTWRDAWERSSAEAYADAYAADGAQER